MKVFKDGNAYCVVRDDFEDLQVSPAVFYNEDTEQGKILANHMDDDLEIHLSMEDIFHIRDQLGLWCRS